jgi:Ca2+-binding RTX toxin-like protein
MMTTFSDATSGAADQVYAGMGQDMIGADDAETVFGAAGDDVIQITGTAEVYGGDGNDSLAVTSGSDAALLEGGAGSATLQGGADEVGDVLLGGVSAVRLPLSSTTVGFLSAAIRV